MIKINKGLLIMALFMIGISLFYFSYPNPYPDIKLFNVHDPFVYLAEAQNWIKVGKFGLFHGDFFAPTKLHPPGFSCLLVPVVYLFGIDFFAIKSYLISLALIAIFMSYRLFRIYLDSKRAFIGMLFFALSPFVFLLSRIVMAEMTLALFFMITLIGFHYLFFTKKSNLGFVLAISGAAGATMIKGLGCALWLAPLPTLLILKQKKSWQQYFIFFVLAALPFVLFWLYNRQVQSYGYWGGDLSSNYTRSFIGDNAMKTILHLANEAWIQLKWYQLYNPLRLLFPMLFRSVFPSYNTPEYVKYFAIFFNALFLWILVLRIKSGVKNLFLEGAAISSLIILLLLDSGEVLRFWIILFPFLIVYLGELDELLLKAGQRLCSREIKMPIFMIVVLTLQIPPLIREVKGLRQPFRDAYAASYVDAAIWAKRNIRIDDQYALIGFSEFTSWPVLTGIPHLPPFEKQIKEKVVSFDKLATNKKLLLVMLKDSLKTYYLTPYYGNNFGLAKHLLDKGKNISKLYSNSHWEIYQLDLDSSLLMEFINYKER